MSVRVSCVLCTEVVLVLLQICCVVCIEAEGDGGPAASEFLWSETDGSGRRGGGSSSGGGGGGIRDGENTDTSTDTNSNTNTNTNNTQKRK